MLALLGLECRTTIVVAQFESAVLFGPAATAKPEGQAPAATPSKSCQ
ncbi:MAG: hypothetical protein MUC50_22860 [Myxococcota bacterium]|nr:hypothetical protein [Myxococcota bacterium]